MALPKPEKRIKEPKPLTRKTALKPYKVDGEGRPILLPPKPRKPLQRPQKPLKQVGKRTVEWLKFRKQYLKDNPPNERGNYVCRLRYSANCLGEVPKQQITVDHVLPRSRRPDLRLDATNLVVACWPCNHEKGSRV